MNQALQPVLQAGLQGQLLELLHLLAKVRASGAGSLLCLGAPAAAQPCRHDSCQLLSTLPAVGCQRTWPSWHPGEISLQDMRHLCAFWQLPGDVRIRKNVRKLEDEPGPVRGSIWCTISGSLTRFLASEAPGLPKYVHGSSRSMLCCHHLMPKTAGRADFCCASLWPSIPLVLLDGDMMQKLLIIDEDDLLPFGHIHCVILSGVFCIDITPVNVHCLVCTVWSVAYRTILLCHLP